MLIILSAMLPEVNHEASHAEKVTPGVSLLFCTLQTAYTLIFLLTYVPRFRPVFREPNLF
jgi:hypothetical protein